MIITFRANVPNATPASAPVTVTLNPMARAIQEIIVFSNTGTLDLSKTGFRLKDRGPGRLLIPDSGSWGQENFAAAGEMLWAPIPASPLRLDMNEQLIEGPPFQLTLEFYNTAAAAILVAGFVVVRDPFISLRADQPYELLEKLGPPSVQAGRTDMPLGEQAPGQDVNRLVSRLHQPTVNVTKKK